MAQNLVIPNKDNKAVFTFAGVDLTLATDISVVFGAETYTLLLNPTIVIRDSATQLSLDLSATSEVGQKYVTVTYFDSGSVNGTDITSQELNNLGKIIVAVGTQLIIEDGSVVANSNSYASDAELKAYALLRGKTVPATQPEREALLVLAMDYIESYRAQFIGEKTDYTQPLQWPRSGAYIDGYDVGYNTIPQELKNAQMEAAIISNSNSLLQTGSVKNVQKEKVDVIERTYFSGGSWEAIRTDTVDVYLDVLLSNSGKGINAIGIRA